MTDSEPKFYLVAEALRGNAPSLPRSAHQHGALGLPIRRGRSMISVRDVAVAIAAARREVP